MRLDSILLALAVSLLVGGASSATTQVSGSTGAGSQSSAAPVPTQPVVYVDADATGLDDGSSWGDAFDDLQDALSTVSAGEQVWVAEGTYTPAGPGGDLGATFTIPSGVCVYGGFAGGEVSLGQRQPDVNVTTLSGDLDGDDVYEPIFHLVGANSSNVVRLSATSPGTALDGFEVLAGHTFGSTSGSANGAGLLVEGASARVVDCRFSWCVANEGGAIYIDDSELALEGCRFENNYASTASFAGGAIATVGACDVSVSDCTFTNNTADGIASGCAGGAIAVDAGAVMLIERCEFVGNTSLNRLNGYGSFARGGAIYNDLADLTVAESTFRSNISNSGGAIFAWDLAETTILNCEFIDNRVFKYVSTNGIEIGGDGGTIVGGAALELVGSLVYGGEADNIGGVAAGAGFVSSCIFWGNSDSKGDIGISQVKADEVRYSVVQNMLIGEQGEDPPDPEDFPGSKADDPLFLDPLSDNFRLGPGSPAIDAAENPAWPSSSLVDRDGNQRFVDDPATVDTGVGPAPVADMGPFEFGSTASGSGGPPGVRSSVSIAPDWRGHPRLRRSKRGVVLTGARPYSHAVVLGWVDPHGRGPADRVHARTAPAVVSERITDRFGALSVPIGEEQLARTRWEVWILAERAAHRVGEFEE